jgi:eukaryotic-like serine/threonine-protein kinase
MATCPTCRTRYPNDAKTCAADGDHLLPDEAFSGVEADLAPGVTVGEYVIEKKLGEGGFGSVYRATHPLIGKTAAIKVLNRQYSSNPQMVSRFIAEARAVNQIRHRNIIDIFSFGKLDDGRQYYVMELLEGMTFDAFIKQQGRLAPDVAIPILRSVARASTPPTRRASPTATSSPRTSSSSSTKTAASSPSCSTSGSRSSSPSR